MYKYTKEVEGKTYQKSYKGYTFLFMLDDLLEKKGWSQREAAKNIGEKSHMGVHKLAAGKLENVSLGILLKLCVELGCTLNDLLPIVKLEEINETQEEEHKL